MPTILIVGGYGTTGYRIAELLLRHTNAALTLAGRNEEKAKAAARRLQTQHGGDLEGLRLDAEDERPIRLSHEDAYTFTAIPVAACIMQYLEGAHEPGLYFQSHFLKPESLLEVLQELGIRIHVSEGS